jgi:galactokinase
VGFRGASSSADFPLRDLVVMKEQIVQKFRELFGTEGTLFEAPGRINLIGEHTDYNNGFVLPGAIDKYMRAMMRWNGTDTIRAFSINLGQYTEVTLGNRRADKTWANYLLGTAEELKKRGADLAGFDCVFGGDIPPGAGLSSSAALESVIAFGLNELGRFGLSGLALAEAGQMAEHHYAGVKCGIMDQFISLHGKKDHVLRLDCRSMAFDYHSFPAEKAELLLMDTGVKHELAASEYNVRRQECEKGVAVLHTHFPDILSLRDAAPEQIMELKTKMPETVFKRCLYVTEENNRVSLMCEALERGDAEKAGACMNLTHQGLSALFEVSCAEADFLAETCLDSGLVYGARMMGGGFGGCILMLTKTGVYPADFENIREKYGRKFARKPEVVRANLSNGAGYCD